jgi:putative ABC transport system permease protein
MSWWNWLFRKSSLDAQLETELRFHIDKLTSDNIAAGMTPEEARRQATLEFGGREQVKEELRDVHRIPILEALATNLRFARRLIRKSPVFSVVVVLTLALGIGANSAVFSVIDAVLLRPLPFPHGDQLMLVRQYNPKQKSPQTFVAPVRLEDWNRMNSTFQSLSGYYTEDDSEISGVLPEKLTHALVAPRFLQVLGVSPTVGRDFTPEEERFGGPEAVLISYRLWQRRFGGDPSVLRKTLRLEKHPWPIVGVMPAGFAFPDRSFDVWSPVPTDAPFAQSRENTWYTVIGRLKPGVNLGKARADIANVQAQLGKQFPKTDGNLAIKLLPLKDKTVDSSRRSLWILFGSVTLLLLIACTNIAALLLARMTEREHEISVRFSLGGSRRTVIAQLLTEVFLLAVIGSLVGLGLASGAAKMFRTLTPDLPRVEEITLDWRIVGYSLACSLAVTFLCGILPAFRGTGRGIAGSLANNNRTQVSGRNPVQWALVGVQVALAVTLLVGAGLLQRSLAELARVSPGFDPSHVLTLHISMSYGETADMKALAQRTNRMLDSFRAVPGVEAAAAISTLPGIPGQQQAELKILEGEQDPNRKIIADSRFVSTGYFAVMHIPMLAGEPCKELANSMAVIVNRSFANTYFGQSPAIGHHLTTAAYSQFPLMGEVRGIVGDAREQGLNTEPLPTVYWCSNVAFPGTHFVVRTRGEPGTYSDTLRRTIHEIEPSRSVFDVQPLQDRLTGSLAEDRLRTTLLTLFALTAVSLACLGLYGTLSYFVSIRRREVGLRIALGALRRQIALRFLLQGLRVSILGCLFGLALAGVSVRLLSGMLYGVSSFDPATFGGVVVLVLLVAALATILPAARAARTDPMRVLREE